MTTDTFFPQLGSVLVHPFIVLPNDFAEVLRAPTPLLEDVEGQALACPSD